VRKLSLIGFADAPWVDCSGTHNGVRKRTPLAGRFPESRNPSVNNPVKLHSKAPLAMRMLISTYVELVPSPIG